MFKLCIISGAQAARSLHSRSLVSPTLRLSGCHNDRFLVCHPVTTRRTIHMAPEERSERLAGKARAALVALERS